jgi:hypothetical protein
MYKLLLKKSYLLFVLVSSSFFSCEQILELIKPTDPTKPVPSCRIKMEEEREFTYDQEGKLTRIYGPAYSIDTLSQFFVYNDKDQIIRWYTNGADIPPRNYAYDSIGRLKLITILSEGFYHTYDFTHRVDTIVIDETVKTSDAEDAELLSTSKITLCFKNGNLVRAYKQLDNSSSFAFDYGYTYTNTPNRIMDIKKKFAFLLFAFTQEAFIDPLISKNLPQIRKNLLMEDPNNQTDRNYTWILNEKGYPLNNGLDSKIIYEYECSK